MRPRAEQPIEEKQWHDARIRLYHQGVSCPSKDEVNEEVDRWNSPEEQYKRRTKEKKKYICHRGYIRN